MSPPPHQPERIISSPTQNQEGEQRIIHRAPTLDREGESTNNPVMRLLRSRSIAQGGTVNVEQQEP
eukprot:1852266-Prorocentrum_lima.AAC.1